MQTLTGRVLSASTPIVGATVAIYAAGGSPGSGAGLLVTTTSDTQGNFTARFSCPDSSTILYATALGGTFTGSVGGTSNLAIALLAIIGACNDLPGTLILDELTTVAAAYALDAFIAGGPGAARADQQASDAESDIGGGAGRLMDAVATASLLANSATGGLASSLPAMTQCTSAPASLNCEVRGKLIMLADALGGCVESPADTSAPCAALFACATPAGGRCNPPGGGSQPVDTLGAVLSIARNPGTVAVSGIYQLATQSPVYGGPAPAAPGDWTLALGFIAGGLGEPTGLALDGAGDVWVANYTGAVAKFSPTGVAQSPVGGYAGGGLEASFGIAVDADGNVWVTNEQSAANVNDGLGSVTELSAAGSILSGANGITAGGIDYPVAVVLDAGGNIWISNFGDSSLTALRADGAALSGSAGFSGGGLAFPVDLAVDAAGNVWAANQGADRISEFAPSGTPLSSAGGYTAGGFAVPQGIAVDQTSHIWVTNSYGDSVTELTDLGVPLSGAAGYSGGGLQTPGGIAIDGAGTVWVANYRGASISELAGAGATTPGAALSPPSGFVSDSLLQPFALAVDPSGDLWVTSFGNNTVVEFIGIAAPVKTPAAGPPRAP